MVNLHEDEFRTYHGPGHGDVRRIGGAMLAGAPPTTAPEPPGRRAPAPA